MIPFLVGFPRMQILRWKFTCSKLISPRIIIYEKKGKEAGLDSGRKYTVMQWQRRPQLAPKDAIEPKWPFRFVSHGEGARAQFTYLLSANLSLDMGCLEQERNLE